MAPSPDLTWTPLGRLLTIHFFYPPELGFKTQTRNQYNLIASIETLPRWIMGNVGSSVLLLPHLTRRISPSYQLYGGNMCVFLGTSLSYLLPGLFTSNNILFFCYCQFTSPCSTSQESLTEQGHRHQLLPDLITPWKMSTISWSRKCSWEMSFDLAQTQWHPGVESAKFLHHIPRSVTPSRTITSLPQNLIKK